MLKLISIYTFIELAIFTLVFKYSDMFLAETPMNLLDIETLDAPTRFLGNLLFYAIPGFLLLTVGLLFVNNKRKHSISILISAVITVGLYFIYGVLSLAFFWR